MTTKHTEATEAAPATDVLQRIRDAIDNNANSATQIAAIHEILNEAMPQAKPPAYPDPSTLTEDHEHHGRGRRHV